MDKEKIIFIGSNHEASLELSFKRAFEFKYTSVEIYPAKNIFLNYYNRSILNKSIYRLGLSSIINTIQYSILKYVDEHKPNRILVFKGMELTPNTIETLKRRKIQIINYNPDHPFIFSGRGSGNKYVTESIKLFDYYFSYDREAVEHLKKLNVNAHLLPFGFDHLSFDYQELSEQYEIHKVCFIGNADKKRQEIINYIASNGIKIDVYGENWRRYKLHKLISIHGPKYGYEFWETLQKYAVQLNFLRRHNILSHNMRTFDIPGSGGIMLSEYSEDQLKYFSENTEAFYFRNFEDAINKIKHILNLSFIERNKIRFSARSKALEKHTYLLRVSEFLTICNG